jgi:hypothetical protein
VCSEGKESCQGISANGDISIERVRKDDRLLRENWDTYTVVVGKIFTLPRETSRGYIDGTWLY